MATENSLTSVTVEAGADLSSSQYLGVKLNTDDEAIACDTAGEQVYGVLQNEPDEGEEATVAIAGLTKAEAGGSISIGDDVAVAADGQFVTSTTGDIIVGIARSAASAAGEIITLDFRSHLGTTA